MKDVMSNLEERMGFGNGKWGLPTTMTLVFQNTPYNLAAIFPLNLILSSHILCLTLDNIYHNLSKQVGSYLTLGINFIFLQVH
jgi:hypothetical protein